MQTGLLVISGEEFNTAKGRKVSRAFSEIYALPERKKGCLFRLISQKKRTGLRSVEMNSMLGQGCVFCCVDGQCSPGHLL